MAVYLYTLHAYRSWMPDHPRGYVQRRKGIVASDATAAKQFAARATHPQVRLDAASCRKLVEISRQACAQWGWRWHAAVAVWSHLHVLISWPGYRDAYAVRKLLKRSLTQALVGEHPWASRSGSVKRILDRSHFDRLVKCYLPSHGRYGGYFAWEGDCDEDIAAVTS